jgi:tetratricopeptide (TPR) repeat protein
MLGKNAQASGHYEEAEMYLLHGVNILPERIYPHYLLAKLYLEMGQEEKAEAEIHTVLTKPPKVESKAVDEMRIELVKLRVEK